MNEGLCGLNRTQNGFKCYCVNNFTGIQCENAPPGKYSFTLKHRIRLTNELILLKYVFYMLQVGQPLFSMEDNGLMIRS